jgi:hypothetical protein
MSHILGVRFSFTAIYFSWLGSFIIHICSLCFSFSLLLLSLCISVCVLSHSQSFPASLLLSLNLSSLNCFCFSFILYNVSFVSLLLSVLSFSHISMKIQTQSRKQDFGLQMHIETDLDIRSSTVGVC